MSDEIGKSPAAATIAESTGLGDFQVLVRTRGATFFADEPIDGGGLGSGPNPYDLLCTALAACTAMTLRLYARMKSIPLESVHVEVAHQKNGKNALPDQFTRLIRFEGNLDDEARERLLQIAQRCPIHRTLTTGARIETKLATK
jgi:putative redox protein